MKKIILIALAIAFGVLIFVEVNSPAYLGLTYQDIERINLRSFKGGEVDEVIKVLGEPHDRTRQDANTEYWTYQNSRLRRGNMPRRISFVIVSGKVDMTLYEAERHQ